MSKRSNPCPLEVEAHVLQAIRQHARSSMDAEICGVLLGHAARQRTVIDGRIEGAHAAQGVTHVTFTQETWEHIYHVKDREFPNHSIVGWYHSHPGFGVFLSDYDLFIHKNFFAAPHQVAWVFDPHSDEEGCFGWHQKRLTRLRSFTIIDNRESMDSVAQARLSEPPTAVPAATRSWTDALLAVSRQLAAPLRWRGRSSPGPQPSPRPEPEARDSESGSEPRARHE